MKKLIIYITTVTIVIILTVSVTYAFFVATTSRESLQTGTGKLDVIYDGDEPINGQLTLAKNKEEGYNRTINIALSPNSVSATGNIYIAVEQISAALATQAFKWEVYQVKSNQEIFLKRGTFEDCGEIGETKSKCTNGDKIYILNDYRLSTTAAELKIYIWLNGHEAGNEVVGTSFSGYIGAEARTTSEMLSLQ